MFTAWETCNKYQIKNTLGQQVYFAGEGAFYTLVHVFLEIVENLSCGLLRWWTGGEHRMLDSLPHDMTDISSCHSCCSCHVEPSTVVILGGGQAGAPRAMEYLFCVLVV